MVLGNFVVLFLVFLLMLLLDGLVLQLRSGGSSLYGVLAWFKC